MVERALAPRWVAQAMVTRSARLLRWGEGPDAQPMDLAQCERVRLQIRQLSPQWALTTIRLFFNLLTTSARLHGATRDPCFLGGAGQSDALEHYLKCLPLRLVIGLHDDEYDPTASICDTFALGPAAGGDAARSEREVRVAFRRCASATAEYNTLRAHPREHGLPSARFAATTASAVVQLHLREVSVFWRDPPPRPRSGRPMGMVVVVRPRARPGGPAAGGVG